MTIRPTAREIIDKGMWMPLVLASIVVFHGCEQTEHRLTATNLSKLHTGQSYEDVVSILGPEDWCTSWGDGNGRWIDNCCWKNPGDYRTHPTIGVTFINGRLWVVAFKNLEK